MRSRYIVALILVIVISVVGSATFLLTSTFASALAFGMGVGDTRYAAKWRDRFAPLPDPETAKAAYPEVEAKRFPNGEWVFGVSADSHGSHWGGTVVYKDSSGRTRAFFGHVCGPRRLSHMLYAPQSLKEFYDHSDWEHHEFQEYAFPPAP
jgi:hypothetical protein